MTSDYKSIPCALYERFELAVLHHQRLRISWRDESGITHMETVQPRDLQTRNGAEYLFGETLRHRVVQLRLDRILRAETLEEA